MTSPEEIDAAWEDLGRQLADLRRSAGLTQQELARRIGFSRTAVAEAETGAASCESRADGRSDEQISWPTAVCVVLGFRRWLQRRCADRW
jgi:DNA-binding XRE family transcriptional regulator